MKKSQLHQLIKEQLHYSTLYEQKVVNTKLISAINLIKEEERDNRVLINILDKILDRLKNINNSFISSDIVDKLEDLDTSLDYIASALTGKNQLDIGVDQAYLGRLSSPGKIKNQKD